MQCQFVLFFNRNYFCKLCFCHFSLGKFVFHIQRHLQTRRERRRCMNETPLVVISTRMFRIDVSVEGLSATGSESYGFVPFLMKTHYTHTRKRASFDTRSRGYIERHACVHTQHV